MSYSIFNILSNFVNKLLKWVNETSKLNKIKITTNKIELTKHLNNL